MVKKNSVASKHVICLAVVARHPIGIHFCGSVRALRFEDRFFALWRGGCAEHFTGGGLIIARLDAAFADCLQNANRAQPGNIASKHRQVKAHAHMALSSQVIDLIRSHTVNQVGEVPCVCHVTIMEVELDLPPITMWVMIDVVNPPCVESACSADQTVDFIAFIQQELRQVGTVLPCYSCNQCFFHNLFSHFNSYWVTT